MKKSFVVLPAVALLISLVGPAACRAAERDISTYAKALIGHWKIPATGGDIYFAEDMKVTQVRPDGDTLSGEYTADTIDAFPEEKAELEEMGTQLAVALIYQEGVIVILVKFSPDYQSIEGLFQLGESEPVEYKWDYVDGKQQP